MFLQVVSTRVFCWPVRASSSNLVRYSFFLQTIQIRSWSSATRREFSILMEFQPKHFPASIRYGPRSTCAFVCYE